MTDANELVFDPEIGRRIQQLAEVSEDVLITGPSGSGKSEVAKRIHHLGPKRSRPFIPQNCAAIPKELAESTLFGHERGAFTTAHERALGIVAAAEGGTLFLDEIGELPLDVQVKLLTLLQDRKYRPLGSVKIHDAKFRLIAATNRDLLEMCNQGLFREDLYHRINVLSITLPSLRDKPRHAQEIAAGEVARLGMEEPRGEQVLAAVARLCRHPAAWPGNAREILAFVRRCVLGVEEAERQTREEWARWRRPESGGRLTAFAPSVSPSLADRERYAGLLHELAGHGQRPKTAVSREVSLELASRLLDVFPAPLPLEEVQAVLGARDRRTLTTNVDMLVSRGLVERRDGGIVALWPRASSTLLGYRRGEWVPAGPGAILSLEGGERVRIEVTSAHAGTLGIMLVSHGVRGASEPVVIIEDKELFPSRMVPIEIELDGARGLEQILVHVGPPAGRGGRRVEPLIAEAIMPDFAALESGRRTVLERWQQGWLGEHLVWV